MVSSIRLALELIHLRGTQFSEPVRGMFLEMTVLITMYGIYTYTDRVMQKQSLQIIIIIIR